MDKSRDIASRASTSIAAEGSGISVVCSLPWYLIIIANLAKGGGAGCGLRYFFLLSHVRNPDIGHVAP
jgi:hypothetical protein